MLTDREVLSTLNMLRNEHLDVRPVTLGISLFDCASLLNAKLLNKNVLLNTSIVEVRPEAGGFCVTTHGVKGFRTFRATELVNTLCEEGNIFKKSFHAWVRPAAKGAAAAGGSSTRCTIFSRSWKRPGPPAGKRPLADGSAGSVQPVVFYHNLPNSLSLFYEHPVFFLQMGPEPPGFSAFGLRAGDIRPHPWGKTAHKIRCSPGRHPAFFPARMSLPRRGTGSLRSAAPPRFQ